MTVAIILVNWNGWRDTIECLESLFRLDYASFRVIVVDNSSSDGSVNRIKEWAAGVRSVEPVAGSLVRLSYPPVLKPIAIAEYSRAQAEAFRNVDEDSSLVLIHSGSNLGFAGGNNAGLRYVLARPDFDYAWLLNNDTVVESDALSALVRRSQAVPEAGIIGSTLLFYSDPDLVQAYGGATFKRWSGSGRPLGMLTRKRVLDPAAVAAIERATAYTIGASMLVTLPFLLDVGLMDEAYFLYFEELDWARRGQPRYQLAFAPSSIVYHKVGQSAGTESIFSLHYLHRSRLRFMRLYYPWWVPSTYMAMIFEGFKALIKGRRSEVLAIFRVILSSESRPTAVSRPADSGYPP